jgi:hypothetical protein
MALEYHKFRLTADEEKEGQEMYIFSCEEGLLEALKGAYPDCTWVEKTTEPPASE